jgi:hypothetical protein
MKPLDKANANSLRQMPRPFKLGDIAHHRLSGVAGRVIGIESLGSVDGQLLTVELRNGRTLRAIPRAEFSLSSTMITAPAGDAFVVKAQTPVTAIEVDLPVGEGYNMGSLLDEIC